MLWNVVNPPKNLPIEDISSPSAPTLELCDELLFKEPLQNVEITSTSNCCCQDNFFKTTNISFSPDIIHFPTYLDKNATEITAAAAVKGCSLSEIFDSPREIDNDISVSIDFPPSSSPLPPFPNNYQEAHLSLLQSQPLLEQESFVVDCGLPNYPPHDYFAPLLVGPTIPFFLEEEECLSLMPNSSSYSMRLSSFLGSANTVLGPYLPAGNLSSAAFCDENNSGIFTGSEYVGNNGVQNQELEFQGDDAGIFYSDPLPGIYDSSTVFQTALSNGSTQHAVNGTRGGSTSTPSAFDISSLEDYTFKAAPKCPAEERRDKIHRYLKKRNERNFSKKIKYVCRKTLADSRPRVRGRFARNDELINFCKTPTRCCGHNEEDSGENVIVEDEDMVDSSNIFTHISGVNSFKCNHLIHSNWI